MRQAPASFVRREHCFGVVRSYVGCLAIGSSVRMRFDRRQFAVLALGAVLALFYNECEKLVFKSRRMLVMCV